MSDSICGNCAHLMPVVTTDGTTHDYGKCDLFPGADVTRTGWCDEHLHFAERAVTRKTPQADHHHESSNGNASVAIDGDLPSTTVADLIRQECAMLRDVLLSKNAKYGNSALEPVRVFSKADPVEQIRVRLDDKLSRLMRGQGIEDEDVELDLMGYLILLRVARRMREAAV
ncbi:MAG: high-potential iron-sulfur protein [Sphingobacterium sp.]|nr:high-potential iron-sulfur protein [Sphingobacterium sp.]